MSETKRPRTWRRRLLRCLQILVWGIVALLVLRWFLFHGPVRAPESLEAGLVVDLHCHTAGLGAQGSGCFVSASLRDSYKFDIYLSAFSVSADLLQQEGDAVVFARLAERVRMSRHVDRVVVLALDGVINEQGELDREHTEVYVPSEFVEEETRKYPELLFGASINPYRPDAVARLEAAAAQGAVLVKWLPAIQWVDPSDPRCVPFYAKLVELDLPLLTHAGQERSFTGARDEFSDPERLRLPLKLGVRVIAAHAATTGENEGQNNLDRLIGMLDEYDNLFVDVSSLTQLNKLGLLDRVLQEERFEGRMLYGSDYPLICTLLVSPWYFPLHLSLREMGELTRISNPLDRDVRLKQALGVPARVFTATARFLGVD